MTFRHLTYGLVFVYWVLIRDPRWWWCLWNCWFIIWFTFDCHRHCLLRPSLFVSLLLPAYIVWPSEMIELEFQSMESFINLCSIENYYLPHQITAFFSFNTFVFGPQQQCIFHIIFRHFIVNQKWHQCNHFINRQFQKFIRCEYSFEMYVNK